MFVCFLTEKGNVYPLPHSLPIHAMISCRCLGTLTCLRWLVPPQLRRQMPEMVETVRSSSSGAKSGQITGTVLTGQSRDSGWMEG